MVGRRGRFELYPKGPSTFCAVSSLTGRSRCSAARARRNQFDCETPIRFGQDVETDGPPAVIDYRFTHYSSCAIWVDAFTYSQGDIAR